ncbi:serine hydrolase BPHL-like [Saccoglossus kowalevskii]|uniref:Valacyclovir hydrolase-like n=1 Tax=Saccoglossus kowalevskii TaxID=10224 RepID=A0ABM0H059_SACKO|nr:PREDICTED: valacyclovir hydrolase-like [Saccoglossus kowalevskii]
MVISGALAVSCRHAARVGILLRQNPCMTTRCVSSGVTEHQMEVNGASIHYKKAGTGALPVLLLPGALGSSDTDFSPQLEGLNRNHLTVIAWDPRGYGKSRPAERNFSAKFFDVDAKDAVDLMKKIGFQKFSLLGWSDGAITALIAASRYASVIDRLVVWGGNAYVTADDVQMYEATRDISKWSERMRAPMIKVYGDEFEKIWNAWMDGIINTYYHGNNGDICKKNLCDVKCPTLIVHGEKDAMVPMFHADYLHANIKGSRLVKWSDGKHNLHLRYAEKFNKLVLDFLLEGRDHS